MPVSCPGNRHPSTRAPGSSGYHSFGADAIWATEKPSVLVGAADEEIVTSTVRATAAQDKGRGGIRTCMRAVRTGKTQVSDERRPHNQTL